MWLPFRARWPVSFGVGWLALVPPAWAQPPAPAAGLALPVQVAPDATTFGELKVGPESPPPVVLLGPDTPYAVSAHDTLPPEPLVPPPSPPGPGWFGAATFGVVRSHVSGRIGTDGSPGSRDRLPFAQPGGTVQPRIELGYRLPEGAGDLRVGYRNLSASGDDGGLHSRVEVHAIDLDYVSHEWLAEVTPDLLRDLRAVAGVRLASGLFDSSGPTGLGFRSRFLGAGPRLGLEWRHPTPGPWPLELYARVETTGLIGHTQQTIAPLPTGPWQGNGVAVLGADVGVGWRPFGADGVRLVAGYQVEQWWNLGRSDLANADLTVQGVFVRGEWRY